jgi:SP family arabinose:H+ symporter-like MFS transporter
MNYICIAVAMGGLLFGFDTAVISGAIGFLKLKFSLSPATEGWLVSSGLLGCITGVVVTGFLSDGMGRKKTIMLAGIMFLLSAIGCGVSSSFTFLIISRMAGGVGVGMASVVSPMYIAEFAPAGKRGRMIAYYQLAITVGILISYFSNALLVWLSRQPFESSLMQYFSGNQAWRPMFLMMAVPSIAFMMMLIKVPESPRWLTSVNRKGKAREILNSVRDPVSAAKEFKEIEQAAQRNHGKRISVLDRSVRLPLLIGIVLAVLQQFSGINAILYYGPGIFSEAGIGSGNALFFQVLIGAVNCLFTLFAIRTADRYGRKFLLITGLGGIILSLLFCGYLFYTGNQHNVLLLAMIVIFIACFAFSLGPVTWIIINEIFPAAVRAKAVSICTLALWIAVWLIGQFFPWLLEKAGPAFSFWIFAVCSMINLVFCWKVIRETKNRTLEEMEDFFVAPH